MLNLNNLPPGALLCIAIGVILLAILLGDFGKPHR